MRQLRLEKGVMNKAEYDEIKQAWGTWLSDLSEWDWFVTLTFRDPEGQGEWTKPGWATAKKAWREFTEAAQPALGELEWVRMFEMQKWRGVPHIHALVGKCDETVRRMELVDWAYERFGITRVEKYDSNKGASFYLCKYVTKSLADIDFSESLIRRLN